MVIGIILLIFNDSSPPKLVLWLQPLFVCLCKFERAAFCSRRYNVVLPTYPDYETPKSYMVIELGSIGWR